MTYRIVIHGRCTGNDGLSSAYIFKKYWKYFVPELTQADIDQAEMIGLHPNDIQNDEIEFTDKDIVLDLPRPNTKVYFWCDHHSSNKRDDMNERDNFKIAPSNTGYLIDLAVAKGLELTPELKAFKEAVDRSDSADYTKEMIQECYYDDIPENPSALLKFHMLKNMIQTRDRNLNELMEPALLSDLTGETPLSSPTIWAMNPQMFHRAALKSYQDWRDNVDEHIVLNKESKCTVQDGRNILRQRGVVDRFYSVMKFPEAVYTFVIKEKDDEIARIGIGSNIFRKDARQINIGKLCKRVAVKFGDGAGGGHDVVGGAAIFIKHYDEAKEFVLECMKQEKIL